MTYEPQKQKHLEFVQGVIYRLSSNSSRLKGWSVIIVSAFFALSTESTRVEFAFLACIPTIVFWGLDGFFLWHERLYREIFDHVRALEDKDVDFAMSIEPYKTEDNAPTWLGAVFSKTLIPFYGSLLTVVLIVMLSTLYMRS